MFVFMDRIPEKLLITYQIIVFSLSIMFLLFSYNHLFICFFLSFCPAPRPPDSSSRFWKWRFSRQPNVLGETSAWTATSTPPSLAAVATLWLWTLRRLAGTGSLLRNATKRTTAPASASTCSCRSTHTPTWCSMPTPEAPRGPAAPRPRCPPLTCFTSMTSSRSFMARSRGWWWIDAAALRLPEEAHTLVYSPR